MSPRHNRRRVDPRVDSAGRDEGGRARLSSQSVETSADGDWMVRTLLGGSADSAGKVYRCPGCDQEIPASRPHVVAWLIDGDPSDRRHWHTPCWRARGNRAPTIKRGRSAPRYG